MASQNYRLIAWQKSMDLVTEIYRVRRRFPKDELFVLTSQLRRAAISIPSNIAEGQGRSGDPEFCRFLRISHGSLREAETQILIAGRLEYLPARQVGKLMDQTAEVGRLINGLIRAKDRK